MAISREAQMINFLLAAARTIPKLNILNFEVPIRSPKGAEYLIIKEPIIGTELFSLYHCLLPGRNPGEENRVGLLKIATKTEFNTILDREAMFLNMMREQSLEIDEKVEKKYRHHYFFPEVVESFVCNSQQNRRISILDLAPDINGGLIKQFSLKTMIEVHKERVDPRTSVWIIGKLLKTLIFAHEKAALTNENISAGNIIIEKSLHNTLLLNWSSAKFYSDGEVPGVSAKKELADLGSVAFQILGGDKKKGVIPSDPQLTDDRYVRFLARLAKGEFSNARRAYNEFYSIADSIWAKAYYDFTTYKI